MSVKRIPLTQGKVATIDARDYILVRKFKWNAHASAKRYWYARSGGCKNGKPFTRLMHRIIIGAISNDIVDHIDGDGLNNRRSNLRITSRTVNNINKNRPAKTISGHVGIKFERRSKRNPWVAFIAFEGRRVHIGQFSNLKEAVAARISYRNSVINKLHKKFSAQRK